MTGARITMIATKTTGAIATATTTTIAATDTTTMTTRMPGCRAPDTSSPVVWARSGSR